MPQAMLALFIILSAIAIEVVRIIVKPKKSKSKRRQSDVVYRNR